MAGMLRRDKYAEARISRVLVNQSIFLIMQVDHTNKVYSKYFCPDSFSLIGFPYLVLSL